MEIAFRKAVINDLEEMISLVNHAVLDMEKQNLFHWDSLYPTRHDLQTDILENTMYVGIRDEQIVVIFVLNQKCDDEYRNGKWLEPEKSYYVLHKLCVNPQYQNRGIAKQSLLFIENEVKAFNVQAIRLDVYSQNMKACHLYTHLGYKQVGVADWRKGRFYLMEKYI